jgi:TRAP-type C4-dicarboxylate transport system substrate-binding protein
VHRHHRYITLSGHFWGGSALVCNAAHYRGWPADVRAAVDAAAREATLYQRQLAEAEDVDVLAKLDPAMNDVIRLTDSERAEFVRAVEPVLDRHRARFDPALFAALGRT